MAMIPPVSPAIPMPVIGQPHGDVAKDAEIDTKKVNAVNNGEATKTSERDGRTRSERSGQFSNTGTTGTRGGDAGLLSRGAGQGVEGGRETRAGRKAEQRAEFSSQERTDTVREAIPGRASRETSVVERTFSAAEPKRSGAGEPDTVKTERFVETLEAVRGSDADPVASAQKTDAVSNEQTPGDAAEVTTSRYDKRA